MTKKPKLELLFIDSEGNAKKEITVRPTFPKKEKPTSEPPHPLAVDAPKKLFPWQIDGGSLVSIGIEISNVGNIPAYDIMISLEFPKECELFSKADVEYPFTDDLEVEIPSRKKPTEGGLYVPPENKSEARAWAEILHEGHKTRHFDEVYLRFPEAELTYKIQAKVTYKALDELSLTLDRHLKTEQKTEIQRTEATQDELFSENFEFLVTVKPEVINP